MTFWSKIQARLGFGQSRRVQKTHGRSFLTFQHTGDVLHAENVLREANVAVDVMGPPSWLRKGCDMVLVCSSVQEPFIRTLLLENGVRVEEVYPMGEEMLEPVSLFQVKDFGEWIMVRAANMKITFECASGKIVNVSGGGCPDVPYLASLLTGKTLSECVEPRSRGQTLCSYSLQKAFEEARKLWRQKNG